MRRLMVSQASAWIFFGIGRTWGAVKSASHCCYPLGGEVDKHLQEEIRYTGTGRFVVNVAIPVFYSALCRGCGSPLLLYQNRCMDQEMKRLAGHHEGF
jgi:hypothetical protein